VVTLVGGDYAAVRIEATSSGTLHGHALARTTIAEFYRRHGAPVVPATPVYPHSTDLAAGLDNVGHRAMTAH
jgi:hypothetical protein